MKQTSRAVAAERLLTVGQVAELLGTTERFPRRLIAERRIEFVKIGRHVRISEVALAAFIDARRVEALTSTRGSRGPKRVA
jgi:excisionase family DNA binding protein